MGCTGKLQNSVHPAHTSSSTQAGATLACKKPLFPEATPIRNGLVKLVLDKLLSTYCILDTAKHLHMLELALCRSDLSYYEALDLCVLRQGIQ